MWRPQRVTLEGEEGVAEDAGIGMPTASNPRGGGSGNRGCRDRYRGVWQNQVVDWHRDSYGQGMLVSIDQWKQLHSFL